jgi:hypothetical protein
MASDLSLFLADLRDEHVEHEFTTWRAGVENVKAPKSAMFTLCRAAMKWGEPLTQETIGTSDRQEINQSRKEEVDAIVGHKYSARYCRRALLKMVERTNEYGGFEADNLRQVWFGMKASVDIRSPNGQTAPIFDRAIVPLATFKRYWGEVRGDNQWWNCDDVKPRRQSFHHQDL